MLVLQVAGRHIVEYSVAKDIFKGILFANVFTSLANNNSQFGLPVDLFRNGGINDDLTIWAVGGRGCLGEKNGMF